MHKRILKQLVDASYTKNELQHTQIEKIAGLLSRKELKAYIRALKAREKMRHVFITGASDFTPFAKDLQSLFPEKKLVFASDPSLLAGMRVQYADTIYELSMQNTLKQLEDYLNE